MLDEVSMLEKQIHELKGKLSQARRRAAAEPVGEYEFRDATTGRAVSLAELFGEKDDLLVLHNMGRRCVYCTLWADGMNGFTEHLNDRAAFVLCSADDAATAKEFASSRGWRYRVVSGAGSDFAKDMGFMPEPGKPWPGISAFHRNEDGSIVRTGRATLGPGDDFCAVWPMFDMLAGGAGEWSPKYTYSK